MSSQLPVPCREPQPVALAGNKKEEDSSCRRIEALPKEVVDRIAAGETIHRPASIAKELIENSLDAKSNFVEVVCSNGGLSLLTVTDDGTGIHPNDLQLAATRFSTSKLTRLDDLKSIKTFGFRGEALSSASMVGRLAITSRRRPLPLTTHKDDTAQNTEYSSACAYKQAYINGQPLAPKPAPTAGKVGTSIKLSDLFYNVPSRRRAFDGPRKESEEYGRILAVAQRYAIRMPSVAFVCRKKGGNCDLNTGSLPSVKALQSLIKDENRLALDNCFQKEREVATRDIIGYIFGSSLARELLILKGGEGDVDGVSLAALDAMRQHQHLQPNSNEGIALTENEMEDNRDSNAITHSNALTARDGLMESVKSGSDAGATMATESNKKESTLSQYSFAYRVFGLVTNGSYCVPKSSSSSAFVLFINGRLVESAAIRLAVEGVYTDTLPRGSAKPFIYLSLELPGPHLDVNVHPTKREVAFLHEDRLCDALKLATKEVLGSSKSSRTFYSQTLLPTGTLDVEKATATSNGAKLSIANPALGRKESLETVPLQREEDAGNFMLDEEASLSEPVSTPTKLELKRGRIHTPPASWPNKKSCNDAKNFVRTNLAAPSGALEPFLVSRATQENDAENETARQDDFNSVSQESIKLTTFQHSDDCEFAAASSSAKTVDMSIPGAFASAICRCLIQRGETLPSLSRVASPHAQKSASAVVRPKKVIPTESIYESVQSLRSDVANRAHRGLSTKLRDSIFVGCVSRHRSLIQWGIELLMVNHAELAREMFFQLSLARFGGAPMAVLSGGVNVKVAIEQALQFEETSSAVKSLSQAIDIGKVFVNETNSELANQATMCLTDHAKMLHKYFSICLEMRSDPESKSGDEECLMLTGLPILLEGNSPCPHGLPLFLLRLATEVDWKKERLCFEGICNELGLFYSEIPYDLDDATWVATMQSEATRIDAKPIDEVAKKYVQHTLFPALSYLLIPPNKFASDGTVVKLALLSKLYKVFERC